MELKVAYLHNKFGSPNSIEVPDSKVILNEDFIDYKDVIRIPEQINHFRVYWITHEIGGEICLPGQWNYCYLNGKFYHLVQMHSNGYFKGSDQEWFYYNLTYDDWQNDWMNNTFRLKGTINLTGDKEIVKRNIHQMTPIVDNVNNLRVLNGIEIKADSERHEGTKLILPEIQTPNFTAGGFTSLDLVNLNIELKKTIDRIGKNAKPNEDKLVIPLLYRSSSSGNWKGNLLKGLERHYRNEFLVFDVAIDDSGQASKFRHNLEQLMHSEELYLVASRANKVYSYSKSINPTKGVEKIDLSECTDIEVLDGVTLTPLYTLDNPPPKITATYFVDKILEKQGWDSSLRTPMLNMYQEITAQKLGAIVSVVDNEENKVFRDVTVEKIERNVVDLGGTHSPPIENPEFLKWRESTIQGFKKHKNFIFDNAPRRVYMFTGARLPKDENLAKPIREEYIRDADLLTPSSGVIPSHFAHQIYEISGKNNLVLPIHEYKLVSPDDKFDFLDFSRNVNQTCSGIPFGKPNCIWFGLIPDYDRKTHVLAMQFHDRFKIKRDTSNISGGDRLDYTNFIFDPHDSKNLRKITPITPFILTELVYAQDVRVNVDGKKPSSEFLKKGLGLGGGITPTSPDARNQYNINRVTGCYDLRQGAAFMALQQFVREMETDHITKYKHGGSRCNNKNSCNYSEGYADNDDYRYTADFSKARRYIAKGTEDDGKEFQTEFSFPLHTDTFDIIDILQKNGDIPTNFLRGKVVGGGLKHGNTHKNIRYLWDKFNKDLPNVYRVEQEMEDAIPKNTMVYIGVCTRLDTYDNQEKYNQIDKPREIGVTPDGKRHVGYERIQNLLNELNKKFFLTKGEIGDGSEIGAIPNYLVNETAIDDTKYPRVAGKPQLSLSYCKPYKGLGYIAYTRFLPCPLTSRFKFKNDGTKFSDRNRSDGFVAIIPNNYGGSSNYEPQFTFREQIRDSASEKVVSSNAQMAFLYNDFIIDSAESKNYRHLNGGNHAGEDGGSKATDIHENYRKKLYNGNNILLQDYLKNTKTYVTRRTDNPTMVNALMQYSLDEEDRNNKLIKFTTIDDELPPFVAQYMDPTRILNEVMYHGDRTPGLVNDQQRLTLFRQKLEAMCRDITQKMSVWNTGIKFKGTNWYASVKLNNSGTVPVGDYELFTDRIDTFKNKEQSKGNFVNYIENDVDAIINTRNELNIYGTKIPLKSRKISDDSELDLGLHVKPIHDESQSMAAVGYYVEMNLNNIDVIRDIIETPKELTKYSGVSIYERERLIRELGIRSAEYLYNKQQIEFDKRQAKFLDTYEKDRNHMDGKYTQITSAGKIIAGLVEAGSRGLFGGAIIDDIDVDRYSMLSVERYGNKMHPRTGMYRTEMGEEMSFGRRWTEAFREPRLGKEVDRGKGVGRPPHGRYASPILGNENYKANRRKAAAAGLYAGQAIAHGIGEVVNAGIAIGASYDGGYIRDELRKNKYQLSLDKLNALGDIVNKRHEFERRELINEIGRLSGNVQYPKINSNIAYKLMNRELQIKDVHLVQYFPDGELLKYIKKYYYEYGYPLLETNQEITGASDIKRHIGYEFVYELDHPHVLIKGLIEARAMLGVKIVPWTQ